LVHMLIKIVSEGGNLCLNIGPTADGLIPVIMQQRLLDIGKWLVTNGDAIYGTTVWNSRPAATKDQTIFYTAKGNDVYVICTNWPEKQIFVSGLNHGGKVTLLGSNVPIKASFSGGKLRITPPAINPGNNPCEYAWVFKISNVND
jgi:alpha-L-fucosidase